MPTLSLNPLVILKRRCMPKMVAPAERMFPQFIFQTFPLSLFSSNILLSSEFQGAHLSSFSYNDDSASTLQIIQRVPVDIDKQSDIYHSGKHVGFWLNFLNKFTKGFRKLGLRKLSSISLCLLAILLALYQ